MYETRYHRPATLADASALFAGADDAMYLAGGQTLIPTMKQRLAAPSDLIDIAGLDELKGITVDGSTISIGAAVTHADVTASKDVISALPTLAALAGTVGDPAVRQRGTIGGSLANNDPTADYPAAILALNATIHTNQRSIGADEFIAGLFTTALEDGELVVRVSFPIPAKSAYQKIVNPASRYAMAGVFIAIGDDGAVRVAVTGASNDGAFRSSDLEQALSANFNAAAVDSVTIDPAGMLSDIHGSADYRANLVRVMARRAVAQIA
jgi:carbon-monoxide dehydrogenase medium subunit